MSESAPARCDELDWSPDQARQFGQALLEVWIEFLTRLRELPVARRHTQEETRRAVTWPIDDEPMPVDEVVAHVRNLVFEQSTYAGHPRFMAYVMGAGTVPGAAADLVAAALNQNIGAWRLGPAATEIELHLARWFAEAFGLPSTAGGLLTSGGAMANFIALKAARDAQAGSKVMEEGLASGRQLVLYAAEEVHVVVARAVDMLGIGKKFIRYVPTDDRFRLRVDLLRDAIDRDLRDGLQPFAVVGTAGTVATGAIDPLDEIADVCSEHDLWFHVDGAYGAPAMLVPELRPLFVGLDRADSLAFDPHKWLYTPQSGGCVLVRDMQRLADSFSVQPLYVHEDKERTGTGVDLLSLGPQFSRGFSGLKIWVSLLAHGRAAYVRRIGHDVELARYLHELVQQRPDLEAMAPVILSIVCFRYVPPTLPDRPGRDEYLDLLNERLMTEIQGDGRAYCSNAVIRGRFVLRACIVNFRTEAEDVQALVEIAADLGAKLDAELRP